MRVLFTCVVGFGHFNPMVPLARAFVAAGHDVAVATDPAFCPTVEAMGFTAHPAGLDHQVARARFREAMPDWASVPPADLPRYLSPVMFGRIRVPAMLADLGPILERWRPGLLIHDSAEMAGAVAAEVAGIAHVEHSFGLLRPLSIRQAATDVVAPISAAAGVRNPGVGGLGGETYLDVCPPRLQFPEISSVPNVIRLRPVEIEEPPDSAFEAWLARRDGRPIVYLTMGTVFNEWNACGRSSTPSTTSTSTSWSRSGPTPTRRSWAPGRSTSTWRRSSRRRQVLRRSRVMISHGGSGAMLGAIAAGVPILAIPQGADQFMNAARIVEAGLGLRILPEELGPETVRTRLTSLLDDRTVRGDGRRLPGGRRVDAAAG